MMNRRAFLAGTIAFSAAPLAVEAEQAGRVPRIGLVGNAPSALWEAFEQRLSELGYVQNRSIALDYRFSEGRPERFPDLVSDLVGRRVDVLVVVTEPAARAAKQATVMIPIVMIGDDPAVSGLVASFARPGGNITGLSTYNADLMGKRLELLKELVPRLSHVAVLGHATDPGVARMLTATEKAATALQLTVQVYKASEPIGLERALAEVGRARPGGLIVLPSPWTFINRTRIAELAAKSRVPAVYGHKESVEAGGLLSYGTDNRELWVRAATYVDKLLKGAKPADLPVQQPTTFTLVINLKVAKALGLTIPPSLLQRADQIMQ